LYTLFPCAMQATCPGDEHKLLSNFLHSPIRCFLLGTPSNKIFRLNRLKFHLTIPHSVLCEVNFVFPTFCLISALPE
jgi:hypothetical protein